MASKHPLPETYQHRRTKSSVLSNLSFMHKRTPSAGAALSPTIPQLSPTVELMQFLPQDHPHYRALGEIHQNQQTQASQPMPKKTSRDGGRPNTSETSSRPLHKKTLSSYSLKSLAGKDTDKPAKVKEPKPNKPKKIKSSTNLATLLKRPKSSKNIVKDAQEEEARAQKDKENQSPTTESGSRPPPIYAQYSSEYFARQPLGGKFLENEIDRYTPQNYSPGKQRNFYQGPGQQPSLLRRDDGSTSSGFNRPMSYIPNSFSIGDIGRRVSNGSSHSLDIIRRVSGGKRPSLERKVTDTSTKSTKSGKSDKAAHHKGQRVMAAVSAIGSKTVKSPVAPLPVVEDKDVDTEFEAMLDRRNIPENQRGKMRKLAMSMKKDFIKQDWAEVAAAKNGRPGTNSSDSSADATNGTQDVPAAKSKRPRSRTFTLSRHPKESTAPTKKSKADGTTGKHSQQPSQENLNSGSRSFTASSVAVAQNLVARAKGQLPDDFIAYLRKVQKPELVEVGRLHKLRTLLKHETVAWIDDFVTQGGMAEIVGLLHRIIEVEWREEHEDTLLHEVLLCLKALSTTALAFQHLSIFQQTLFPALLNMVFGEEKKGPSEFTTRNVISSLLFTYLKSAPLAERANRARILLGYLRDPEPVETERPVGFVLEMRKPRPYRVWCKEVTNVTKEVFWIFLHHVNVVALPGSRFSGDEDHDLSAMPATGFDKSNPYHVYMAKHFPQEQPPVPAAPYVGGVEWDATNYLASHLDIVNGIMASLPTQEERNNLREEMLVSGWEKCFGGTLRTCKEKFYGGVHAGLRCWVAAAVADGWDSKDVRCGPCMESKGSPKKTPKKAAPIENAPKIEMKLDFLGGGAAGKRPINDDVWL